MKSKAILRISAKLLIPSILLFALYVQFHGDFGPGGGFQAGVIFGAAFILYALIFGMENARKVFPASALRLGLAAGVSLFIWTGIVDIFLGRRFLDYDAFGDHGQHLGIFTVELGVGITVACAMITIFNVFASQPAFMRQEEEE